MRANRGKRRETSTIMQDNMQGTSLPVPDEPRLRKPIPEKNLKKKRKRNNDPLLRNTKSPSESTEAKRGESCRGSRYRFLSPFFLFFLSPFFRRIRRSITARFVCQTKQKALQVCVRAFLSSRAICFNLVMCVLAPDNVGTRSEIPFHENECYRFVREYFFSLT